MKRITTLIIVALSFLCNTYGQANLPDNFSKRLGQLLNNPQLVDSTLVADSLKTDSTDDKLVAKTCSLSSELFYIIKQDYCLYDKKNKKLYGYNDNEQFGTTYSLGIKCKGFNLLFDESINPWKYDVNYAFFKSNKLEPVVSKSSYLLLCDTLKYNYAELDTVVSVEQVIKDESLYAGKPFTSSQDGFDINTSDTCNTGFLVWILKQSGNVESGDVSVKLKPIRMKIEMQGNVMLTPPSETNDVLGCVFVTENGKGINTYDLAGVATFRNNLWTLCFPFKNFKLGKEKTVNKVDRGRLTEIKALNKKK